MKGHERYDVVPYGRPGRLQRFIAQCECGHRTDSYSTSGLAGAAHDLHVVDAEVQAVRDDCK